LSNQICCSTNKERRTVCSSLFELVLALTVLEILLVEVVAQSFLEILEVRMFQDYDRYRRSVGVYLIVINLGFL